MNLLPKSTKEFSSKQYWDSFFQKRQNTFEWYGEYSDLCGVLHKYCKPQDHVLVAGCGNSDLSQDLFDVGYHSLTNIDISDVVIRQMIAKNATKRPEMAFLKMDLLDMKFEDESFQVVVDKGTLDAIFTSREDEKIVGDVNKIFAEISRVLKVGGRYICVTLAQEHICQTLMEHFVKLNWFIRVHKVDMASTNASPLPVFAFILTKTRPNPESAVKMPQILETVMDESEKVQRLNSLEDMTKSIEAIQEYALIKHNLKTLHPEEQFKMEFWSPECIEEPRYSLTVVDLKLSRTASGKFAVFIVPQGREHEWMFCEREGQLQLAQTAGYQRLVIVALNRGHQYADLEKIQEELSGKIMEIAQHGVTSADKVPFLSIGSNIGKRKLVHEGSSPSTGDYIIEDVEVDGQHMFRHLIFLSNKNIIQSEMRLCCSSASKSKSSKKKKGAKKSTNVDMSYLACQHHQAIIASFSLLDQHVRSREMSLLLIGLGGGSLPMFIHDHFPLVTLTIVELDCAVAELAKQWFSFQESERMKLHIADGLHFIQDASGSNDTKYDIVIYDADSKDPSKALSAPPQAFVEAEMLNHVKDILNPGGLFLINLVCRDVDIRQDVITTLQHVTDQTFNIDIEDEVNQIVICKNSDVVNNKAGILKKSFLKQGKELQDDIAARSPNTNIDLTSLLENLEIL